MFLTEAVRWSNGNFAFLGRKVGGQRSTHPVLGFLLALRAKKCKLWAKMAPKSGRKVYLHKGRYKISLLLHIYYFSILLQLVHNQMKLHLSQLDKFHFHRLLHLTSDLSHLNKESTNEKGNRKSQSTRQSLFRS